MITFLILNKTFPKDWGNVLHFYNTNCDYNAFIDKFNELHDQCIPLRK